MKQIVLASGMVCVLILVDAVLFPSHAQQQIKIPDQEVSKIVKEGSKKEFDQMAEVKKEELKDKAFTMWARVACPARKQAKGDTPEECEMAQTEGKR